MILIGITGGVGCGKSEVLRYLEETYNARVLFADNVANLLKEPGMPCYQPVIDCLGEQILDEDGRIGKGKMEQAIFSDSSKLEAINAINHQEVRHYIGNEIARDR